MTATLHRLTGPDRVPIRERRWAPYALIATVCYLPLLVAQRGVLNADTKLYLYLDPGGLLERAQSLWDPAVGGGTVTHQTIGYLWPMGPFYWFFETIGVPDWVAQRLWVGTILFVAAAGVLHLTNRLLGPRWIHLAPAVFYGLSPYVLGHVTGQSALLLPFAALPWMVIFMDRACREGGWRWPAAYALAVTTCGSLNGSSVFFVVVGSTLWAPLLVRSTPSVAWREVIAAVARCGVLTLATQMWWLVGYAVGGSYGLPLLATTETLDTTSATTASTEVIRGLGYWFFYGADTTGPWLVGISTAYMTNIGLIVAGFALPVIALALGARVRWPHRTYFATLAALGVVLAVGAYAAADRSPFGSALAAASESSDLVLSLRNTQRATPLLLLGLAGLLAAGLHVLGETRPRRAQVVAALTALLVAATIPNLWTDGLVAERFSRPDSLPEHWTDAAEHLDDGSGRVLEIPGIDFGAYRWGHTLDPVSPGLTGRPVVARELVPMGSAPGVSLLGSLDRSIQEGWFEMNSLAPTARLLGASDILVRNDLEFERYRTVRPRVLWSSLAEGPAGLGPALGFGDGYVNRADPDQPMLDEGELGIPLDAVDPPALVVFPVEEPHALVRAEPTTGGTVVAGDGDGIIAAAAAGLLDGPGPLLLGAEVVRDHASSGAAASSLDDETTHLILTDSNRLRGHRWYSMRENTGPTEVPGQRAMRRDSGDARIPPVGDQLESSYTIAEHRGAARVWASAYGNPVTMTPENRAVMAFDGDTRTAWTLEARQYRRAMEIGIELHEPHAADQVTLRQPVGRPGMIPILSIEVRLDDTRTIVVDLDERSFSPEGQPVDLDGEPFTRFEIKVLELAPGTGPTGFSTIEIPGVEVEELIHLPSDLTDLVGSGLAERPVSIVLSRQRINPADVVRSDPEPALRRVVTLPVELDVELSGTARVSAAAADNHVDEVLGIPSASDGGLTAISRERLGGSLAHRASSAFDGDADTAWRTPFGGQAGSWIEVRTAEPFEMDTLVLDIVSDGRHTVPTEIILEVDGSDVPVPSIPPIADREERGAVTRVELPLGTTVQGTTLRITNLVVEERTTRDWYTGDPIALPIGFAAIAPDVIERPAPPADLDDQCRGDLVTIDGVAIPVRVLGTTAEASRRGALSVEACESSITLPAGEAVVRSAMGADSGIDIDGLVMASGQADPTEAPSPPSIRWERHSATEIDVLVEEPGSEPFWLVFSESWNEGWEASIDGRRLDPPTIHDSFGMGWWVDPADEEILVELRWAPQGTVDVALGLSALAVIVCVGMIALARRHPPLSPSPAPTLRSVDHPWPVALAVAVLVAVGILVGPIYGVLFGGLMAAGFAVRGLRSWLQLLPAALVAIGGLYVALQQARWGHPTGFDWPEQFARVHHLVLAAPIILAVLTWFDPLRDPVITAPGHRTDPTP